MSGTLSSLKRALRTARKESKRSTVSHRAERLDTEDYATHPNITSVGFICGLHRSGTTLLERLLVQRFEVSYLRASVPESEGQHMQTVFSAANKFGGPGGFAFRKDMLDELEAQTDYTRYNEQILNEWSRFIVGDSPTLLEKSPPHLTKLWWLRKVFPGSKFIIVTRDPRAVSAATRKWAETSLAELMMHWNAAYSKAAQDFDESDCIIARYEDLMERPAQELDRLGAFLSLKHRSDAIGVDARFAELTNSNGKYITAHEGTVYGHGIWNKFGYDV